MKGEEIDSYKIIGMIGEQYHAPEWLCVPELRAGTGFSLSDRIDLFAISCFAKAGYGFSIAFEVKISRSDFLNDAKSISKNRIFLENCNQFYFVTPIGLLKEDEIPIGCGLIEAGKKLVIKKIATRRDIKGYTPVFFTSIIKSMLEKNGYWGIDKSKVFKYCGQELSREQIIAIGCKEFRITEKDREYKAYEKCKKDIMENNELDLIKLVKGISKITGKTWVEGGYNDKGVYSVHKILRIIEELKAESVTKQLTSFQRDDILRKLDTIRLYLKEDKN